MSENDIKILSTEIPNLVHYMSGATLKQKLRIVIIDYPNLP